MFCKIYESIVSHHVNFNILIGSFRVFLAWFWSVKRLNIPFLLCSIRGEESSLLGLFTSVPCWQTNGRQVYQQQFLLEKGSHYGSSGFFSTVTFRDLLYSLSQNNKTQRLLFQASFACRNSLWLVSLCSFFKLGCWVFPLLSNMKYPFLVFLSAPTTK